MKYILENPEEGENTAHSRSWNKFNMTGGHRGKDKVMPRAGHAHGARFYKEGKDKRVTRVFKKLGRQL